MIRIISIWRWKLAIPVLVLTVGFLALRWFHAIHRLGPRITEPAAAISGGTTLFLAEDGTLWGWGDNRYGQLPGLPWSMISQPRAVMASQRWKSVSGMGGRYALVRADGTLWGWERSSSSQKSSVLPGQLTAGNDWKMVTCGYAHVVAINHDGKAFRWEKRIWNENPLFTESTNRSESAINGEWKSASAGSIHTLFLDTNQRLWLHGFQHQVRNDIAMTAKLERYTLPDFDSMTWTKWIPASPAGIGISSNRRVYQMAPKLNSSAKPTPSPVAHAVAIPGFNIETLLYEIRPEPRFEFGQWKDLAAWGTTVVGIRDDSTLWQGGGLTFFKGFPTNQNLFPLDSKQRWKSVWMGEMSAVGLTENGKLYVWGHHWGSESTFRRILMRIGHALSRRRWNTPLLKLRSEIEHGEPYFLGEFRSATSPEK